MSNKEKPDLSKLRVEVRHYEDMWQTIKNATMTTIGKDKGKYPDSQWKKDILRAEHSPIRLGYFIIKIYNAPQFVHGHLVRHHVGVTPFISTLRSDRNGKSIMGIFALDLNRPVEIEIETENKNVMDDFYSFVEKWEVKNEEA